MLISYRKASGIDIKTRLIGSGGVMKADNTSITTMAWRR